MRNIPFRKFIRKICLNILAKIEDNKMECSEVVVRPGSGRYSEVTVTGEDTRFVKKRLRAGLLADGTGEKIQKLTT